MAIRAVKEIADQQWKANKYVKAGKSAFDGMTYEEGVESALRWVLGECNELPIEEDCEDDED